MAQEIERLRGRSPATALRGRAGTWHEHVRRYRELGDLGVGTVFLAPAALRGPADVAAFGPVVSAFS